MTNKESEDNILLVFGDSHSVIWEGNDIANRASKSKFAGVKSNYLGSALAYNLLDNNGLGYGKWGVRIIEEIDNLKTTNSRISAIMLCFGEIDIRTQVIARALQSSMSIKDSVKIVVERLHEFAKILYELNQIPVIIWEPIATPSYKMFKFDTRFPTVGTEAERNYATEQFSLLSRVASEQSQLINKKIYSFGISDKLMSFHETHSEYYQDGCHLNLKGLKLAVQSLHENAKMWELPQLPNFFSKWDNIRDSAILKNIASNAKFKLSSELFARASLSRQQDRGYCFHTNNDANPYVIIDIGYAAIIKKIILFNRFDDCFDRSKSLTVSVGLDVGKLYILSESTSAWGADGLPMIIEIPNEIYAIKYIVLTLQEQTFFHLGEVQIFEHSYLQ